VPDNNLMGGCQCGQVRYTLKGEHVSLNVCHCHDCQKQSGSAFGMSLIISPQAFSIDTGVVKTYETTADSGRSKTCAFCPECGVRIYNATSALMAIKAGTLDDTTWLQPDAHYWTQSKQPWTPLPPDTPAYRQAR
jgi:hypothetical protein